VVGTVISRKNEVKHSSFMSTIEPYGLFGNSRRWTRENEEVDRNGAEFLLMHHLYKWTIITGGSRTLLYTPTLSNVYYYDFPRLRV